MPIFHTPDVTRREALQFAALGLASLAACRSETTAEPRPLRVLFVCQFGSVKSPIARELLRRRADEMGVRVIVKSRGITPEEHINPDVARTLASQSIDLASDPLTALSSKDLTEADLVIAFNEIPPEFGATNAVDWSDTPSMNDDYVNARAEFDRRIELLLHQLAKSGS